MEIRKFIQEHRPRVKPTTLIRTLLTLALLPACVSQPRPDSTLYGAGALGISVSCSSGDSFPQGIKNKHIDININSTVLDPRPTNHPEEGIYLYLADLGPEGSLKPVEFRMIGYEGNSPTIRGSFHGQVLGIPFTSGHSYQFEAVLTSQSASDPLTEGKVLTADSIRLPECS